MKKQSVLSSIFVAVLTTLTTHAANAGVNCVVYVPSDLRNPNHNDKAIHTASVPPSPSSDPRDKNRFRYVILKKDNSNATEISRADLDQMDASGGFKPFDGDTLIGFQAAIDIPLYVIYSFTIDASRKFVDFKVDAMSEGAVPLLLGMPAKHFGVVCNNDQQH